MQNASRPLFPLFAHPVRQACFFQIPGASRHHSSRDMVGMKWTWQIGKAWVIKVAFGIPVTECSGFGGVGAIERLGKPGLNPGHDIQPATDLIARVWAPFPHVFAATRLWENLKLQIRS